jgi:hypothetical protein
MSDNPSQGGVNATIPLQARVPQQPNPLQTIGEFANIQNALNTAKAFPGALTLQQQSIQSGQTDLLNKWNRTVAQGLVPLLSLPPGGINEKNFTDAVAPYEPLGVSAHGILDYVTKNQAALGGFDPAVRQAAVVFSQPSENAVAAATPTPATINTGQGIKPVLVAPRGVANQGQMQPVGAPFQVYPSREFLSTQVGRPATAEEAAALGVQPGTPLNETMLTRLTSQGAGGLAGPAGVTGIAGPATPQNPPRLAPGAPQPGPIQAPVTRPTGAVPTGLAPTAPAEMEASVNQYNAASANSNNYQQRVFPLRQAAIALQNADTGPGSETVNHIKSFLLAQAPASLQKYLPGVDPEKIANYDEAVKNLAQYSRQQPGAERQEAAQRVVANSLGIENMQQAALRQFTEQNTDPTTGNVRAGASAGWNDFMRKFAASHDPRGFSWDDQSDAQHAATLKTLTKEDKIRLRDSRDLARKYGMTGVPGG